MHDKHGYSILEYVAAWFFLLGVQKRDIPLRINHLSYVQNREILLRTNHLSYIARLRQGLDIVLLQHKSYQTNLPSYLSIDNYNRNQDASNSLVLTATSVTIITSVFLCTNLPTLIFLAVKNKNTRNQCKFSYCIKINASSTSRYKLTITQILPQVIKITYNSSNKCMGQTVFHQIPLRS